MSNGHFYFSVEDRFACFLHDSAFEECQLSYLVWDQKIANPLGPSQVVTFNNWYFCISRAFGLLIQISFFLFFGFIFLFYFYFKPCIYFFSVVISAQGISYISPRSDFAKRLEDKTRQVHYKRKKKSFSRCADRLRFPRT